MSGEEKQTATEDVQLKGGQDEGSLSSIIGETPHPVFSGHPATLGETFDPEKETPEEPPETPPEETKPPETPPETPEEKSKKYKSWEEAEAGALAHQRMATEKAEEAARLREELAALKAESEKPPEQPPAKPPEEVAAETETRIESALAEIADLDEFDPDYRKKVAKAWTKAGFGGGAAPMPETDLIEKVWGKIEERLQERERPKEEASVQQRAAELAASHGLDMSEGSADNIIFWTLANQAPAAPFEEQVKWTAEEVKKKLPRRTMTEEERRLAEEARLRNAPLERGGAPPPPSKKEEGSFSLNSILEGQMHSRII